MIFKKQKDRSSSALANIQRSGLLAVILFTLFLLIDPPVTILGWLLSLGIAVFIVYIILQAYISNKTPK